MDLKQFKKWLEAQIKASNITDGSYDDGDYQYGKNLAFTYALAQLSEVEESLQCASWDSKLKFCCKTLPKSFTVTVEKKIVSDL